MVALDVKLYKADYQELTGVENESTLSVDVNVKNFFLWQKYFFCVSNKVGKNFNIFHNFSWRFSITNTRFCVPYDSIEVLIEVSIIKSAYDSGKPKKRQNFISPFSDISHLLRTMSFSKAMNACVT
jgi:hypothetical protein